MLFETSDDFGLNTLITCYELDLTKISKTTHLEPTQRINVEVLTKTTDNLLENSALTFKNDESLLITFFNSVLSYFDTKTAKLVLRKDLSQHDMNKEYFLSPTNLITNKLICLTPIVDTHHFVALNNSNELVLMSLYFDKTNPSVKSMQSGTGDSKLFESFNMNHDFLVAFNRKDSKLIGYNLKSLLRSTSFDNYDFAIVVHNPSIYGFGKQSDHLFIIESKKKVKFYNCSKNKLLAEIPLYSETNLIACSEDFLILSMKDNRIISYLICDSNFEESYKKIKQLKSRLDFVCHF